MKNEIILTLTEGGKPGIIMPSSLYEGLKQFILAQITTQRQCTLTQLIDLARQTNEFKCGDEVGYFLMAVKRDLVQRKIITTLPSQERRFSSREHRQPLLIIPSKSKSRVNVYLHL